MIIIHTKGELGNLMCQYAIGRIIAEKKGYKMKLDESDGWRNVINDHFPNAKLLDGIEISTNSLSFGPDLQFLDLERVFSHSGMIYLHGYWQKHYFYTPYMAQIKEWFSYDESGFEHPDKDDIVVHCRLGGNVKHGLIPPVQTFVDIVNTMKYNKCVVLTDTPDHPVLDGFKSIKNVVLKNGKRMEDFTTMKYARRLILSQSSFSWWASFLGDQEKVYAPLTVSDAPRFWPGHPKLYEDPDLIPDNDKYVKFYI